VIDWRYSVIDLLGSGSFAEVYKCLDVHLDQQFAVKVMGLYYATEDILREARIAARLQHSNILRVVNIGRLSETGSWYIVMDYREGSRTLEAVLDQAENHLRRLPLNQETLGIVFEVASALEYAHGVGVIHQDIKPSNVIIDSEGHAYLTDFGLAMAKRPSCGSMKTMDAQNGLSGTIPYMSPEQFEEPENGGQVGPTADVYSLAVVTYEMLVGQLPYPGKATGPIIRQIVEGIRTPPRQLNAEIPREVEDVLLRSLSANADDRCHSPTEFARALADAAQAFITDEDLYAEAQMLFVKEAWREALARFEHLESLVPGYRETRLFMERARKHVQLLDLYESAQVLLDQGAYESCLDKLAVLKQLDPGYDTGAVQERARIALSEKLYQQATQLYQAGEYQRCLDTFDEIWERDPSFHDKESIAEQARRLLERQQYLQGLYDISVEQTQAENWMSALQTLEELYQEAPYYADVEARLTMIRYIARLHKMYELAERHFQSGAYLDCIEQLNELAQVNDEYKCDHVARLHDQAAESLYEQAERLLEEGHFEHALSALDGLEQHTDHEDPRQVRIKAQAGLAAKELQHKLEGLYDQAAEHLVLRQYTACLDLLGQIEHVDPDYPDSRYLRRRALEGQCSLLYAQALGALVKKQYQEAETLWSQIQALDPEYPDPQNLGEQIAKGLNRWSWLRLRRRARRSGLPDADAEPASSELEG
jgi:serine/threonine protein kinase/thioredoxin-like negative regulator of GroEL